MSLAFLRRHGGRRLQQHPEQPPLDLPGIRPGEETESDKADLDFEGPREAWQPRPIEAAELRPEELPQRFIDGSHDGQIVAWLQSAEGHPIPVRLAEIGGICLRAAGRTLGREFAVVERVVALIVEPFPPADVERFAAALAEHDMRLLPAQPPETADGERALSFDFVRMSEQTRVRAQHEMTALEERAVCQDLSTPSLVDGRLGRFHRAGLEGRPVVGVIKQQREPYLHAHGWRVLYGLEPAQRTPAFRLPSKNLPVVSWYLKLDGAHGALPDYGVVRVEVPLRFFEKVGGDFGYLDRLSHGLYRLRCRQGRYERMAVSLQPIVRAEESLKSLFSPASTLAQHFYHLTGL